MSTILAAEERLIWSESAMTEAGLELVCAELRARTRPVVVECGSGFSTLTLARLLQESEGSLLSLEHDPLWATRVRRNLAAAGLEGTAQVTLAPLQAHPLGRDGLRWYADTALRSVPARIDLLLVDGPPAFAPEIELSRYPALPALADRLAPDAIVVLDDIDRHGEQRILEAWERECGMRFERLQAERIAIGRRPG
jgi:predicted O-methyltransferase YrrM